MLDILRALGVTEQEINEGMARHAAKEAERALASIPSPAPAQYPRVMKLAGRCCSGEELGRGSRYHIVTSEGALCGAKSGRRSAGWSDYTGEQEATCPKCLKKQNINEVSE